MKDRPNFFIVGSPKSGTTSLYEYLKDVPGIYMSPEKEPKYFHKKNSELNLKGISDESKYLKLFKNVKDEKVIGEASPTYLIDPESAELIQKFNPESKIIIILREPVDKAFSQYLLRVSNGKETRSFKEVIASRMNTKTGGLREYDLCIDPGLYYNQVKKYLDVFGSGKVKIIIFEEFVKEPIKTVKEVLEFIGIDAEPSKKVGKAFNPYGAPRGKIGKKILASKTIKKISTKIIPQTLRWKVRGKILIKKDEKPKLSKEDRLVLENFYRNDINELKNLIKTKLPWDW